MPKDRKDSKRDKDFDFKERPAMFAFGQLILPILALVAIGILFLGIKLFFLTPGAPQTAQAPTVLEALPAVSAEPLPQPVANVPTQPQMPPAASSVKKQPATGAKPQPGTKVTFAEPFDPTKQAPSGARTGTAAKTKTPPATTAKLPPQQPAKTTPPKTSSAGASATSPGVPKTVKTPQTPAATPPAVAAPAKGTWEVQIGSFAQKSGAETVAAKARQEGYSSRVAEGLVGDKRWYRVRVVAGNDRAKAAALASELEAKGYPVLVVPAN